MRRVLLFLIVLLCLVAPRSINAQDHSYVEGQIVEVNADISLRSEPGYAGDVVATLTPGDQLTVLDGTSVQADALYWVHVSFIEENATGWIPEMAISGASVSALVPPSTNYGTAPESRNPPLACAGLVDYQTDYFYALITTSLSHAEANDVLTSVAMPGADIAGIFASLSPAQFTSLGAFYTELAVQLQLLDPPDFARAWHLMQIEVFTLVGSVYSDASTMGLNQAGLAHAAESSALYAESTQLLVGTNSCPDFLPWAITQSPFGPGGTTGRAGSPPFKEMPGDSPHRYRLLSANATMPTHPTFQ